MKKNYVKNGLLLLGLLLCQNSFSQSWNIQPAGTVTDFYAVAMTSSSVGVAMGENGNGKSTVNGGANWVTQNAGSQTHYGVHFVNPSLGWAVGAGGSIWKTTTGPGGWISQTSPTTNVLNSVDFVNATTGWAVGELGTLLYTTDGSNWNSYNSGVIGHIRAVEAIDADTLWIVGENGVIRKSTNGGATWGTQPSGTTSVTFNDVFFINSNVGWVVGTGGTVKKTIDGGNTWVNQVATNTINSVHFVSPTHGWLVAGVGGIRATTDGGTTWLPQVSGTAQSLNSVYMTSANEGWAVGNGGVILKYCTMPSVPTSISGSTTVCSGSSQTYSVPNEAGVTYNWTFPVGWTQISGGTSNSVTVNVGSSGGNISVTPSNGCGTVSAVSMATTVSTIPSQPAVIAGDDEPCQSTTVTYNVPAEVGTDFYWTFPADWTQTGGGITNSVTVTVGTMTGSIIVEPSNSCGSANTVSLPVISVITPSQPSIITGNANACLGEIEIYNVTNEAGVDYTWDFPGDWTQMSGGQTNSVSVQVGSLGGTISVEPSNACGVGPVQNLTVTSILVNIAVALNGGTLTADQSGASYQWLECNNGNAAINGATAQSYTPTAPGNYAVQIMMNGCEDTSECMAFVGLDEAEMQLFEVYPNPTNGTIHISAKQPMERVEVISVYGTIIYEYDLKGQKDASIELSEITGVYFIKTYFSDTKIVETIKVVKH